jgi:hypothetical protein
MKLSRCNVVAHNIRPYLFPAQLDDTYLTIQWPHNLGDNPKHCLDIDFYKVYNPEDFYLTLVFYKVYNPEDLDLTLVLIGFTTPKTLIRPCFL